MRPRAALFVLLSAWPAAAQDTGLDPGRAGDEPSLSQSESEIESQLLGQPAPSSEPEVTAGTGAVLRALDKLNATVEDITLSNGSVAALGRIEIDLQECRYPTGDPAGDAFVYLTIREAGVARPVFSGWMIGAAPALNPLDHARYDVWVLRCTTS